MDAARTAKRLIRGSRTEDVRVTIVYRRTRHEMPADEEEIEDALAEGADRRCPIVLQELVSPSKVVLRSGEVVALACVRNELGEPGPDGRRRPVPVPGSEFQIEADAIVVAIGQTPDVSFLDGSAISLRRNRTIDVDPETGLAAGECVYAGGDAVRGPATIIEACADGRRAAEAICQRLGVRFDRPSVQLPVLSEADIVRLKRVRASRVAQHRGHALPVEQREGFDLVEATLTEEAARSEAARCMQCSSFCDKCVEVCPNRANYTYTISPVSLTLPVVACQQGKLVVTGEQAFRVEQSRQIIHVDDFCNECGNCATFCVHDGKPYLEKPRLFLQESDFEQETGNAFYIARADGRHPSEESWVIRRRGGADGRHPGEESRLVLRSDTGAMIFEDERLSVSLSPDLEIGSMVLKKEFSGTYALVSLGEMAVILKGVTTSLPFLPFDCSATLPQVLKPAGG